MHLFKDDQGRDWSIIVNVSAIKQVRSVLGVDLLSLVEDGFAGLAKLLSDPVSLVDTIYVLCRNQAEERGISDEAFGALMFGDTIHRATKAFTEEYTDFFPDARRRAGIKKVVAKAEEMMLLILDRMDAELDAIDPAEVVRKLSNSSGNSPGSSGSIPAPSRFGNST